MKIKPNLERLLYALAIALSLAALVLVALSASQFTDTKVVYQGF